MSLINTVMIVACMVLAACGSDNSPNANTAVVTPTPSPEMSATPTPTPTPVVLTVYSKTITIVSSSNGQSLQGTGYCTIYDGITYCWDDGIKRFLNMNNADGGGFTYWGLGNGLKNCPDISDYCLTDEMKNPRIVDANVTNTLNLSASPRKVADVLSSTSQDFSCTESNGILDCGSFQLDTNQVI